MAISLRKTVIAGGAAATTLLAPAAAQALYDRFRPGAGLRERSTAGDVRIDVASDASLDVQKGVNGQSVVANGGQIGFTGRYKVSAGFKGTSWLAARGISFRTNEDDGLLKSEFSTFRATSGPVSFIGGGRKAMLEAKASEFSTGGGGDLLVVFGATEGTVKAEDTRFIAAGGRADVTSGWYGSYGYVGLTRSEVRGSTDASVRAPGSYGKVDVVGSTLAAGRTAEVISESRGSTTVKESRLSGGSNLLIRSAAFETCFAELNTYTSPSVSACR